MLRELLATAEVRRKERREQGIYYEPRGWIPEEGEVPRKHGSISAQVTNDEKRD